MTRYLLDTNIISELHKPKPHGAVIAWFDGLKPEQVCLSAVTLGELQEGIERMRNQNPSKATEIEHWVDQLEGFHLVIPMDGSCFREAARLLEAKQEDLYDDAMIAATARLHGLTVATRNERDFQHLDVKIVNPFKS
jgi:toxin FitB